ncbi:MAG: protein-L-isoaspartate O-methyltransferase [Sphingomonadaceae bacterium]|nr:protein-L-isoaspartate O-methyltransferase [Sphingomonadaceae bacterium]
MADERREAMIDRQLRPTGVNDAGVLAAFRAIDRARFVPPAAEPLAYADAAVAIAPGRVLLEPMILGLLLTHARVRAGERVLVVGAGTGYSAAVLAAMGARVTALEVDAGLAATARGLVRDAEVVTGALEAGWPGNAPYDLILIDGAAAELPPALLAQGDGGRLAGVIVDGGVARATAGRIVGGRFAGTAFAETGAPVLPGFARAPAFVF